MTWAKMALNHHPLREVKDYSIMLGLGHPKKALPYHNSGGALRVPVFRL